VPQKTAKPLVDVDCRRRCRPCTIDEFLVHYNHERNHQGIGNKLIDARADAGAGPVKCTERLGGLLKFYRRAA
jgi:hypothetical protein